jgi:hypothetical protein
LLLEVLLRFAAGSDGLKGYRTFSVTFSRPNASAPDDPSPPPPLSIAFDRTVIPIDAAAGYMCAQIGCTDLDGGSAGLARAVKDLIMERAVERLPAIVNAYFARTGEDSVAMYPWLDIADEASRLRAVGTIREVAALRHGKVRPRPACTTYPPRHTRHTACVLPVTFAEDKVPAINNGTQQPLEYWWRAAEKMFNILYFDHAEALAYMVLRARVHSDVDLSGIDLYHHFLMLLTEVARRKGTSKKGFSLGCTSSTCSRRSTRPKPRCSGCACSSRSRRSRRKQPWHWRRGGR